ncbi:MAG: carbon-nitrogen hydrolase family protein [Verrucomicrobiae bacterium]|nr:carbon-nitrogen hydrolase family protein [Verrucomicrobiae bacterium]
MTTAPSPVPFPLAMAQMLVTGGDLSGNLDRARQRIAEAAARGARIVLLPEAMDLGWTDPWTADHASPIPDGTACQALRRAAKAHRIWICAGITGRDGNRVFNAAVLISDAGAVVLHHRKFNELKFAHALYAPGDQVAVAVTPFGRIGILICADAYEGHQGPVPPSGPWASS